MGNSFGHSNAITSRRSDPASVTSAFTAGVEPFVREALQGFGVSCHSNRAAGSRLDPIELGFLRNKTFELAVEDLQPLLDSFGDH